MTSVAEAALSGDALRQECRLLARQRALLAAASSLVPIPGVDLAADIALLTHAIERINGHFGLTEAQINGLSAQRQAMLYGLLTKGGGTLAARLTTAGLIGRILQKIGLRLTAMELVRVVPVAGQLVAAGIGYWSFNYVARSHIARCEKVVAQLATALAAELAIDSSRENKND